MQLAFIGAAGTVTGSKYLVTSHAHHVLVDCGLFQGEKRLRLRNWDAFPMHAQDLDAVVLTHAHLDHSGYVPLLVKQGFAGRIFCSHATLALCEVLLADSGRIQEEDAEHANRGRWTKHAPARALYSEEDARLALAQFTPVAWHRDHYLGGGVSVSLRRAGHILGAASVRLVAEGTSVVFSGDLGRSNDALLAPPEPIDDADYVVVESTYGDRTHRDVDADDDLARIVRDTAGRGGVVIIPAFAVGRAQMLLHALSRLRADGRIPDVPVFLNSPMAKDASAIFCAHPGDHRLDEAACHRMCGIAKIVRTPAESRALDERSGPMIIVSASGMMTGGRVLHHVKAFGPDARNTIVLVGYQAAGTRGRALQEGAKRLRIHGRDIDIRAEVRTLPSMSAHADSDGLIAWLRTCRRPPREVFVTHGEPHSAAALARRIESELGWKATVPSDGECVELLRSESGTERRIVAAPDPSSTDAGEDSPCCEPPATTLLVAEK